MSAPTSSTTPVPPVAPATREMVQARTRELAVRAGRDSLAVTQSDYEKARHELTGESEMTRQEAVLDAGALAKTPPGTVAAAAVTAWENEGGQTAPPTSPGPTK
jgi:hypothetical protein